MVSQVGTEQTIGEFSFRQQIQFQLMGKQLDG